METLCTKITRRFHKACADYHLLEDGDHVLIGLSGGKDSLLLTELLGRRAKIYKPRFTVTALHVRVKERDHALKGVGQFRVVQVQGISRNHPAAPRIAGDAAVNRALQHPCDNLLWRFGKRHMTVFHQPLRRNRNGVHSLDVFIIENNFQSNFSFKKFH